jgi:uncharacterized Zn finger protein
VRRDGKVTRKTEEKDPFQAFTWADLQDWAGGRVVSRGRDYQRLGKVQELRRTQKGGLVADVRGGKSYITQVYFRKGKLESDCTCPYGARCKHAVAVILEYLEQTKKGTEVPTAAENDRRFLSLHLQKRRTPDRWTEDADEAGLEDSLDDDDEQDEGIGWEEQDRGSPPVSRPPSKKGGDSLKPFLEGQTKAQLVALIEDLVQRHPEVRQTLQDRHDMSKGSVARMIASVRKDIETLSAEPAWRNHWDGRGNVPDYSRVKERMEALLTQGHADEVMDLGKELLEAGSRQVEMSDDEGELGEEISDCLSVACDALHECSLDGADRILWAINVKLEDEYDLCHGLNAFWAREHSAEDWSLVADVLLNRLKEFLPGREESRSSESYRRDALSDWVITALENSLRQDEIIPLCEQEAPRTDSYVRLVDRLIKAHRLKEADAWIERAIDATQSRLPGIAANLRNRWREMREKEDRWLSVAALRAEEFFAEPSFSAYTDLQKATKKAKLWPEVREAALHFLETGRLPPKDGSWPLPASGLPRPEVAKAHRYPDVRTLVDIAIAEKRPREVLRWYDRPRPDRFSWGWGPDGEDKIAGALADECPDRAIGIWKRLAEKQISLTQPKAYEQAGRYLRKVGGLLDRLEMQEEWKSYLGQLRTTHARKRRFMEVLDGLSGRRIVEG